MASHYEENIAYDLGNLAAFDISSIEPSDVHKITVQNSEKLLRKLYLLEKEQNEEGDFLILPNPIAKIPRERKPPSPKPTTKWENFRLKNGLGRRRKRSRLVYEASVDGYLPRYGSYSVKKLKSKQNAIVEEKNGENPMEKTSEIKNLGKLKQKKRELIGKLVSEGKKTKKEVEKTLEIAKSSTAKLEKIPKKRSVPRNHSSIKDEKNYNLSLFDQITKKPKNKD
jgi:regulator of ribosome biosynthesis